MVTEKIKKIYEEKFKNLYAKQDIEGLVRLSAENPDLKRYFTQDESMKVIELYENEIAALIALSDLIKPYIKLNSRGLKEKVISPFHPKDIN